MSSEDGPSILTPFPAPTRLDHFYSSRRSSRDLMAESNDNSDDDLSIPDLYSKSGQKLSSKLHALIANWKTEYRATDYMNVEIATEQFESTLDLQLQDLRIESLQKLRDMTFNCPECPTKFSSRDGLRSHLDSEHTAYINFIKSLNQKNGTSKDVLSLISSSDAPVKLSAPPRELLSAAQDTDLNALLQWVKILYCEAPSLPLNCRLTVNNEWLQTFRNPVPLPRAAPPAICTSDIDLAGIKLLQKEIELVIEPTLVKAGAISQLPVGSICQMLNPREMNPAAVLYLENISGLGQQMNIPQWVVEHAPEWTDNAERCACHECGTEFAMFRRRHHCRSCGELFCSSCCASRVRIPWYGIMTPVRVCQACVRAFPVRYAESLLREAVSAARMRQYTRTSVFVTVVLHLFSNSVSPFENLLFELIAFGFPDGPLIVQLLSAMQSSPRVWISAFDRLCKRERYEDACLLTHCCLSTHAVPQEDWVEFAHSLLDTDYEATVLCYEAAALSDAQWIDQAYHWFQQGFSVMSWICSQSAHLNADSALLLLQDRMEYHVEFLLQVIRSCVDVDVSSWKQLGCMLFDRSEDNNVWPGSLNDLQVWSTCVEHVYADNPAFWLQMATDASTNSPWFDAWCLFKSESHSPAEWLACCHAAMKSLSPNHTSFILHLARSLTLGDVDWLAESKLFAQAGDSISASVAVMNHLLSMGPAGEIAGSALAGARLACKSGEYLVGHLLFQVYTMMSATSSHSALAELWVTEGSQADINTPAQRARATQCYAIAYALSQDLDVIFRLVRTLVVDSHVTFAFRILSACLSSCLPNSTQASRVHLGFAALLQAHRYESILAVEAIESAASCVYPESLPAPILTLKDSLRAEIEDQQSRAITQRSTRLVESFDSDDLEGCLSQLQDAFKSRSSAAIENFLQERASSNTERQSAILLLAESVLGGLIGDADACVAGFSQASTLSSLVGSYSFASLAVSILTSTDLQILVREKLCDLLSMWKSAGTKSSLLYEVFPENHRTLDMMNVLELSDSAIMNADDLSVAAGFLNSAAGLISIQRATSAVDDSMLYALRRAIFFLSTEAIKSVQSLSPVSRLYVARLAASSMLTSALLSPDMNAVTEITKALKATIDLSSLYPLMCTPLISSTLALHQFSSVSQTLLSSFLDAHSKSPSALCPASLVACTRWEGLMRRYLSAGTLTTNETLEEARLTALSTLLTEKGWTTADVQSLTQWRHSNYSKEGFAMGTMPLSQELNIAAIEGLCFEESTGNIHLLVTQAKQKNGVLSWDDVRTVMQGGVDHCFYMMADDESHTLHPMSEIKFGPAEITSSDILGGLADTDALLRSIAIGLEMSTLAPFDTRPTSVGLLPCLPADIRELLASVFDRQSVPSSRVGRLMLESSDVPYTQDSIRGKIMTRFGKVDLYLRKYEDTIVTDSPGRENFTAESVFARDFNECLPQLTEHIPQLRRLTELTKLFAAYRLIQTYANDMEAMFSPSNLQARKARVQKRLADEFALMDLPLYPLAEDDNTIHDAIETVMSDRINQQAQMGKAPSSLGQSRLSTEHDVHASVIRDLRTRDEEVLNQRTIALSEKYHVTPFAIRPYVEALLRTRDARLLIQTLADSAMNRQRSKLDVLRSSLRSIGLDSRKAFDSSSSSDALHCNYLPTTYRLVDDTPVSIRTGIALSGTLRTMPSRSLGDLHPSTQQILIHNLRSQGGIMSRYGETTVVQRIRCLVAELKVLSPTDMCYDLKKNLLQSIVSSYRGMDQELLSEAQLMFHEC